MGFFRKPRVVLRIYIECLESFNSNGTDTLEIGTETDPDAYATAVSVASTGVKTWTPGVGVAYDATPHEIRATYTAGGTAPSQGAVLVVLEYADCPRQP